jgi:DNA-binding NtrC family response regulator
VTEKGGWTVIPNILHVDSDPSARSAVRRVVDGIERADVIAVETLRGALSVLDGAQIGCVVTEAVARDAAGTSVVERLCERRPRVPVVVFAAACVEPAAVGGASTAPVAWVRKDAEADILLSIAIRRALGHAALAEVIGSDAMAMGPRLSRFGERDFIADTVSMRRVLDLVACAAESAVPVLIEGETGTGKEILARALHVRSPRRSAPFVVQNCGAVADTLLESELFGHVRGAFTGAERDRPGLFLEAGNGTVFLDEIGEAPPGVQAKLLRVLQHGEVKPVGSDRVQRVSARIVAATNRSLADEVDRGRFRADLYYRLAVVPVTVPPLRQRAADVPRLIEHFLARFQREERKTDMAVSRATVDALRAYAWPGNVRELEHEVHRWVLLFPSGTRVTPDHLAARIRGHATVPLDEPLDRLLARVELALIQQRLDRFATKADAARSLGITREALYGKLKRLGAWGRPPEPAAAASGR